MVRREQAACDVCGKDRKCACWDFVVRKNDRGRIAQFTPGTDTVYYENGREVGRSRNTTYAVGSKRVSAARGTAHICMPCRIIRSLVYGVLLGVGLTLLAAGFVRAVEAVIEAFLKVPVPHPIDMARFLPGALRACLVVAGVFALTPFMRHLILALRLSRKHRIRPFWAIVSRFWD